MRRLANTWRGRREWLETRRDRDPLPRRRPRRSHAERREETIARIKTAVVESIAELGFHRTTAAEICRRSGASWGAAQYHFGDKDGILIAVLVDSFASLVGELEGLPRDGASLAERVEAFVDGAWAHIRSPHYRSTFEILLNMPLEILAEDDDLGTAGIFETWDAIWRRFFPEVELAPGRRVTLQYYVIGALSGLAALRKFGAPSERREREQLRFVKETMIREFSAPS